MNAVANQVGHPAVNTKPLWAIVGVLGVSVLALGAALVHVKTKPADPMITEVEVPARLAQPVPATGSAQTEAPAVAGNATPAKLAAAKPQPTRVVARAPSGTPPKPTAANAPEPVAAAQPQALPTQPVVQRAVCGNCGTVEAVTPVTREGKASGVGAVAGGVLGGVVGNQVGKGSGRDIATVLGAVGGGILGHKIEKDTKKTTAYSVRVRMEDGSLRSIEQSSAPAVGARVTVDGNSLHSASGSEPAARPQPAAQPGMVYAGG